MKAFKTLTLLIFLITGSSHSITAAGDSSTPECKDIIRFQAGPFFSQSFANKFWRSFADQITQKTGCEISIHGSPDYEFYLTSLLNKDYDIYITPDYYAEAIIELGLMPAIRSQKSGKIILVSRLNLQDNPTEIKGKNLVVPSLYTRAYLEVENWLNRHNLMNSITLDTGNTHDGSLIKLLKGQADAAAVLSNIYRRMPENIKSRFHTLDLNSQGGGYLFIKPELGSWLKPAAINAASRSELFKWEAAEPPYSDTLGDRFKQQLSAFQAEIENKTK